MIRGWTTAGDCFVMYSRIGRPYWNRCGSIAAVLSSLARIT